MTEGLIGMMHFRMLHIHFFSFYSKVVLRSEVSDLRVGNCDYVFD